MKGIDAVQFALAVRSRNIYAVIAGEKVITTGYQDARFSYPIDAYAGVRTFRLNNPIAITIVD